MSTNSLLSCVQLMLLGVAYLPQLTMAAGPVTLLSNVTFGGLICSTPAVEFTCTAVDATDVEWQRNGNRITVFLPRDTIGLSDDPGVPSGFQIELTAAEQDNQGRTNFTTTLTADLSVLMNGSDQISCHSPGGNDSISITYTGQQPAPPAPLFSHTFSSLRDGEVTLTLTWDETFTPTHAVQMYRVRSDLCPEQCVEPDTPFSCPGLVAGGEYMFWVRAVNCGDQEGEESQPLLVRPQVPRMPNISSVVATYNETSTAVQIVVSWEPVPEVQIIDQFTEPIWYRVTVDNSSGDQEVMTVTCDQSEGTCSASFPLLELSKYTVSISARNIVGGSDTAVYPNEIFSSSSSYYDPSFSFENCITSVLCSSSLDLSDSTRCVVRYGTDPSYTLLSGPVNGPLNSMFQLPLLEPTTTYYFQTSVLINSTLTVQVQEEFTTGEFVPRLLSYHRGLITAGAILWIIALILTVINFLLLRRKDEALISSDNCFKMSMLAVLVVITIFILFIAILWVAVGFQVGLQQNTCDLNWQRHRNGLIISAFVLSVLSLATSSMFHVILILRCIKGSKVPVRDSADEIKLEPPQYAPLSHGPEKGEGFEREGNEGHRWIGKSTKEGIADQAKAEYGQLDQAAIGSGGDGVYGTTRHGEPPKPVPNPEDPQYSHIEQEEKKKKEKKKDKKKNGDNTEPPQDPGEYEHLSHGTGRPHLPSAPGSEEYGKLETHPQDQQAAIGSGGDGVYDATRHDEPPSPIPNPEDPQYSHIQLGEEEKKKKDKKKKKNTSLNPELPSDGIGQQGQTSGTSSQGQIPGTSTQGQIPGTNTQGQIPGTGGLVYDEPNTGPRNLSSVL